ncbi:response regulator transcription factor [Bordetella hinzii]|uniref:DNA-binding response regulator n=2 Tax=Bordetella hinzii TaxID=103855 RepID=A0AAN1RU27_9BORD|nr:response regulator transcription factor [Bordetella hinzii]AKQ54080.1 Transcriptional regulatory protein QseB [Bordetella hinzii]AKQ58570.1 Transcriptional regulatory protein QseB [Bordetella hinzii]AZW16126.1 DNA-binding response regulator [Bordetella hinzii]KCB26224.1 response regulator receiver domain protein [Bordetella hinzii OH87 BAL007II]KCB29579.1 response regulator receiver domain protein [Bordetella hinzii CA90 BAL1384]
MTTARVLIVEDNLTIAGNLYDYLQAQGFMPDVAYDGRAALGMLERQEFDAVLLDVGLPGMDGYAVLNALRVDLRKPVPVLVLTARDGLDDKLAGFSHGADDYLTKPFALAEVKARLLALIQRSRRNVVDAVYRYGPLSLDSRSREVSVNGKPVHLARKSVLIVEMLLRDPGKVVSRETLETALWGDEPPASDALRSQVHLLRRALAEAGFDGIETVHGTGWRLVQADPS